MLVLCCEHLQFSSTWGKIRALKAFLLFVVGIGGVAQLGERCVRNAEVRSSILLISTTSRSETVRGRLGFLLSAFVFKLPQSMRIRSHPNKARLLLYSRLYSKNPMWIELIARRKSSCQSFPAHLRSKKFLQ